MAIRSPQNLVLIDVVVTLARLSSASVEAGLKKPEEVMEILEAYDLAGSLRGAAEMAGCDHKTVAHWVRQRAPAHTGVSGSPP